MKDVGIIYDKSLKYPDFPYNPDKSYPEIPYIYQAQSNNAIYHELRNLLKNMGCDEDNFNTKNWNPFGSFIKKGDKILIKPNFVFDYQKSPFSVITHPSLIRFIIDYAFIAAGKRGEIIIADAPQTNANIDKILKITYIDKLIKFLIEKEVPVKFIDLRSEKVEILSGIGLNRKKLKGDPLGNRIIDLMKSSLLFKLEKINKKNFYGADYNRRYTNYYHNLHRNLYCIANTVLQSDVVISIPKLKTHKKTGVTLNLKNFIGINVHKNFLPHYRIGSPNQQGDAFPNMNSFLNSLRFLRYLFRDLFLSKYDSKIGIFFYKLMGLRGKIELLTIKYFFPDFGHQYFHLYDGNWHGNDTIWRTVLDLITILSYCDIKGNIRHKTQRRFFSVIDGIIAGDKNGPLEPNYKKAGVIIVGKDFLTTDLVSIKIMGLNYKKIPLVKNALNLKKYSLLKENELNDVFIISNNHRFNRIKYKDLNLNLNFKPPIGWSNIVLNDIN